MANSLSASFPEYWSRRMQKKHYRTDRYREVVSMEEEATLKRGDTVHRPYRSDLAVNDLGSEGSYTRQDITDTDESLSIDQEKEVSFYVRDIDAMQSNYKTVGEYAEDAAVKLSNQIDGQVFGEYDQAASDVDAADVSGGTDGDGVTLTTSNIDKVFGEANEALDALNIDQDDRWAVISPQFYNVLWQRVGGKESALGDEVSRDGVRGRAGRYAGFRLIKSNALGWSASLAVATNPTADDTVTINGVTFTFKASPSAAGEVDIGGSAAASVDNLVAAVNNANGYAAGAGAASAYYEVSAANRLLLANITATDGTTAMTLKATGKSYVAVSETLTAAADIWTLAAQQQHNLFGQGNPIDLVIQKKPNMKLKDRDGYIGQDIVSWTVFGLKTFNQGTKQLVDFKMRSDAF